MNQSLSTPTTTRRLLIVLLFAEAVLILITGLEIANGIEPSLALGGLALGTAGIGLFVFALMFFLAGGRARIAKLYPYLAAAVVLFGLIRLVLLFVDK
jgi:hypothetical protein